MFHYVSSLLFCSLLIILPPAGSLAVEDYPDGDTQVPRGADLFPPSSETIPEAALHAAQNGLEKFLNLIPPGESGHFGFLDRGELELADLGAPFMIYTMVADEILAAAELTPGKLPGEPVEVTIYPTGIWQFPVIAAGSPRTLLTVDRMTDGWEAVDLGGLSPAPEILEMAARWPGSEGYQLRYLFVYQTGSQFIWITGAGESSFIPIESTGRSLGLVEEGAVYETHPMTLTEVVTLLAPYIRLSLARPQGEWKGVRE